MVILREFKHDAIPIETDLVQCIYGDVSGSLYNKGIIQSGLYLVRPFYKPQENEELPVIFGTLYSSLGYAQVLFSKSEVNQFGKLEVKIWGDDEEKLNSMISSITRKVEKELSQRGIKNA